MPPTEKQKQVFADILMDALANTQRNGFALNSSIKHTFTKVSACSEKLLGANHKADMKYINSMIKAIMALEDYMDYLSSEDKNKTTVGFMATAVRKVNEKAILVEKIGSIRKLIGQLKASGLDKTITNRFVERRKAIDLIKKHDETGRVPEELSAPDSQLLIAERGRRADFYPDPPANKKRFTSRWNRLFWPAVLKLGDVVSSWARPMLSRA